MKRRQTSLHYCNLCKATTKHTESESTSVCLRCGAIKNLTRIVAKTNQNPERDVEDVRWN